MTKYFKQTTEHVAQVAGSLYEGINFQFRSGTGSRYCEC